ASEFGNIAGIKEASGDLGQVMQIIKNKPEGYSVLSGDYALTYPMLALGADGVISVVANAFPRQFSQMVNLALKGNYEEARSLHYELLELIEALFEDGNPAGIKAALDAMGIAGNNLRLPLVKANKATYNKIATLVNKIKL
ncbi:MAG: 4-hydroxy-tetrahydrodipicolinate synthase, partial [Bacteroidetes bacterium]